MAEDPLEGQRGSISNPLAMRFLLALGLTLLMSVALPAAPESFELGGVSVRLLDDETVVFESMPATPPSIFLENLEGFPGPRQATPSQDSLKTESMTVTVEGSKIMLQRRAAQPLTLELVEGGFQLSAPDTSNLYGLGEQFLPQRFGSTDGDWLGQMRFPGGSEDADSTHLYGNKMVKYHGGAVGNTQLPILYGLRPRDSFFVFLDNSSLQRWDFRGEQPWPVTVADGPVRLVVSLSDQLPVLRQRYMQLVGKPPVPPYKAFGLWVSEYGFDNWGELLDKLSTLEENGFPLDGFVLDLQWFGGIQEGSESSSMGRLVFDTEAFPDPAAMIERLARRGVGLMLIEEAYVARGLSEYKRLAERGFLVTSDAEGRTPHFINQTPWWGLGGMIDYTDPAAGAYWHDHKRQPLVELGILGHWTDLGEPEMFLQQQPDGSLVAPYYHLGSQARAHNLFNFLWSKSIAAGYQRHHNEQRPFIVSRSGAPGIQRFGAALWSGDIGSNAGSLAVQLNVAGHMSWSGIDYFGSDVGGFHRTAFDGSAQEFDDLYTLWFANSCITDVPVRPHTVNLENKHETAPDRVGHRASNLANLKLRYQLRPYYYSLAHRAYDHGVPLVAPLVLWHPQTGEWAGWNSDGRHKMVGRQLLAVTHADPKAEQVQVFLPAGEWYDFRTGERLRGPQTFTRALVQDGLLTLPLYAAAGAIFPLEKLQAEREDKRLRVLAFPGRPGSFEVVEDDGHSIAYQNGSRARTTVRQAPKGSMWEVVVEPTLGSFPAAPSRRVVEVELVTDEPPTKVWVGGHIYGFERTSRGVKVVTPRLPVDQLKTIRFIWD